MLQKKANVQGKGNNGVLHHARLKANKWRVQLDKSTSNRNKNQEPSMEQDNLLKRICRKRKLKGGKESGKISFPRKWKEFPAISGTLKKSNLRKNLSEQIKLQNKQMPHLNLYRRESSCSKICSYLRRSSIVVRRRSCTHPNTLVAWSTLSSRLRGNHLVFHRCIHETEVFPLTR